MNTLKSAWDFVSEYYPNYYSSDLIAYADDLQKILDGEINGYAKERWINTFNKNEDAVQAEWNRVHAEIYEAAIEAYINKTKETICISLHLDDVIAKADDIGLTITEDQAFAILQAVKNKHDTTIWLNWDTIEEAIRVEIYSNDTSETHDTTDIIYKGITYPCRTVSYNGTDYKVGTESLNKALIDGNGNPVDEEANSIDEGIYFYMPDDMIAAPEEAVIHLLKAETDIE